MLHCLGFIGNFVLCVFLLFLPSCIYSCYIYMSTHPPPSSSSSSHTNDEAKEGLMLCAFFMIILLIDVLSAVFFTSPSSSASVGVSLCVCVCMCAMLLPPPSPDHARQHEIITSETSMCSSSSLYVFPTPHISAKGRLFLSSSN